MSDAHTPTARELLWRRRCDLRHVALVSYRYHRRRQRFFDLLDKGTKSVTVALGATLMGAQLKVALPLVASAITALGLLSLVFGYGDRKQAHKELAEQFMGLAGEIERGPFDDMNDAELSRCVQTMATLNAKEPPALKTLVIMCEHEQAAADGNPGHVPLPAFHKRALADFLA